MKLTKRLISMLLSIIMIITIVSVGVVSSSAATATIYAQAAMELDEQYAYDGDLGCIYTPASTTIRVWSPKAYKVVLNLFNTGSDQEAGAKSLGNYDMEKLMVDDKFTGVWQYVLDGDHKNEYYTYSITQPSNIWGGGIVTRETQDIYSKAVGVNGDRSMIVDLKSTDPNGWDNDKHVYVDKQSDASVWEIHVKDFSYNENSGVSDANRGKFLAFTEFGTTLNDEGKISTCIDYLKELGITHVQINPFYDFATIDETADDSQFNWGYDPKNYGVPEGSYSSNPYDGNVRINECKQMIKALHDAGIGVIMDSVYNHTYSRDSAFTYTVPGYYYRYTATGEYSDQSGCGNDTASERYMYRKYMREMIKYWTNEYHIDGFRFDLMGVHDCETMNLIRDDMDEIDERIIMYGEGWSGNTVFDPVSCTGEPVYGCTQTNAAKTNERIGFFNDVIRDGIKGGVFDGATTGGFVSGSVLNSNKVSYGLRANTFNKNVNWSSQQPTQTVSYASCHDNNTLYDKLVAVNRGLSVDYRKRYNEVITQNKLSGAIVCTAQGINFILAGEEMGRSKDGDENSYKSPATENMIDWSQLVTNADMVSYYKGLLEIRKAFSPFTASIRDEEDDSYQYNWCTSYSAVSEKVIGITIDNNKEGEWSKVACAYNGTNKAREFDFSIKDTTITDDTEWVIIADGSSAGLDNLKVVKGKVLPVDASSATIAVEKTTFDKVNKKSKYCKVTVKNYLEDTKEIYSQYDIKGKAGDGYEINHDSSIPIKYDFDRVEGKEIGTFSNTPQEVVYYYKPYTPIMFKTPNGDVNEDNMVDILDGTAIQKYLAKLITLDNVHIKRGDYNIDNITDVVDVTFLQKYLAKLDVTIATVTATHTGYKDGKAKTISPDVVTQFRLGEKYVTTPCDSLYYVSRGTPDNATGIAKPGSITVNYEYDYKVKIVDIYVKHSDPTVTWNPCLWAWIRDETGTDTDIYPSWPGLQLTEKQGDWYHTQIESPAGGGDGIGYCMIISNNGSPQTKDYVGYNYDKCYIVIEDDKIVNQGDWLSIYDHDPTK